jgi:hypothetical protein
LIAALWSGELFEPSATFFGDFKNLPSPLDRRRYAISASQSLSSLSIDLIWSRNSGEFWCPWAETACWTAASSTSSSVPEILSEQFFSLG